MMKLKEQIVRFLRERDWTSKAVILEGKFYYKNSPKKYMSDTVGRTLRSAEEESLIAVKDDPNSKSILYKYIPPHLRPLYIPYSLRTEKTKLFHENKMSALS